MEAEIAMIEAQNEMLRKQKAFNTANVELMNSRVEAQIADNLVKIQQIQAAYLLASVGE